MTLQPLLQSTASRLREAGIENAAKEARWLLAHVAKIPAERLLLDQPVLTSQQREAFEVLVQRRISREPLSHILAHQPFWSLDFYVNMHSLTPRADSETLIEAALAYFPDAEAPRKILDLGTGSGCLLCTLLHEWPHATGLAIDASSAALDVAMKNIQTLGLSERATLQTGNWAEGIEEQFDVVISNPPYIKQADIATLMPEVRDYEPHSALDGGEDGLNDYRAILADAPRLLAPHGIVICELGAGQAGDVQAIGEAAGLRHHETRNDLGGIARAISFTHSLLS